MHEIYASIKEMSIFIKIVHPSSSKDTIWKLDKAYFGNISCTGETSEELL